MIFLRTYFFYFFSLFCCWTIESYALIDAISVSGNPPTLLVNTATAGSQPNLATDTSTTCTIETVIGTRRITGSINSNMPKNVVLQVSIQAPSGATSLGLVSLSTTATNLLLGITALLPVAVTLTYRLTVNVSVAPTSASRTVTFTITA